MESVIDGYGPVCYKTLFGEKEKTSKPEVNGLEVYAHYECEGQISLFEYLEEKEQGSSEE